jgi:hypothetical protein
MNRLLVKLATGATGSLLFSSPIGAQIPPPAPRAQHVEIIKRASARNSAIIPAPPDDWRDLQNSLVHGPPHSLIDAGDQAGAARRRGQVR